MPVQCCPEGAAGTTRNVATIAAPPEPVAGTRRTQNWLPLLILAGLSYSDLSGAQRIEALEPQERK